MVGMGKCEKKMPPTTGKFFYTDFLAEGVHGVHYIDLLIGDKKREYHKFSVSTSEREIGIYTTKCPLSQCNVTNRWNPENSDSVIETTTFDSDAV